MEKLIFLFVLIAVAFACHEEENRDSNDEGLFEGDMKLTDAQRTGIARSRLFGARAAVPDGKWPGAVVHYVIDSSIGDRAAIDEAFNEYAQRTCVRFVERTSEANYIRIFSGSGCWSYVGLLSNGQQDVSLAPGCLYKGTVVHELAHTLGFHHEQSRPDRDNYVDIIWANIQAGKESNFNKYSTALTYGTSYDYSSVMHYSSGAFSANGLATIVAKPDSTVTLGQRDGLSTLDAYEVNARYECSGGTAPPIPTTLPPITPPSSGYVSLCDFDNGECGFEDKGGDFAWSFTSGSTPSSGTGPSGDHTSGQGRYMFIEATGKAQGAKAIIEKAGLEAPHENTCIRLFWEMNGENMAEGRLMVKLVRPNGWTARYYSGYNYGDNWYEWKYQVPFIGPFKLQVEGYVGNGDKSDIAVDDISIGNCS